MRGKTRIIPAIPILLVLALVGLGLVSRTTASPAKPQAQAQITSPERFFGFQMGADRKMARWDKMVACGAGIRPRKESLATPPGKRLARW